MTCTRLHRTIVFLSIAVGAVACPTEDGDDSTCTPGETFCAGIDVVRCSATGGAWDLVEECTQYCTNGACVASCVADCAGKQCGDDGCGSPCGSCGDGLECHAGACIDEGCTPVCSGKQCGDDGCGGSCGDCGGVGACQAGVCVAGPCVPDCTGLVCGDDGCGGSCGSCADGQECSAGGCEEPPTPVCAILCDQPADCDQGYGAARSADNYSCDDGTCRYTGCNTDAECAESFSNDGYGCFKGAPIPYCTLTCGQPSDCDQGAGGAYTVANYACTDGYCEYAGCNTDAECAESFNSEQYGCYKGPGWSVAYCSLTCDQPADCDPGVGGAFSADNYECLGGYCEYLGCTSDAECAESFNDSSYGCN
jgi:hypothetical protein